MFLARVGAPVLPVALASALPSRALPVALALLLLAACASASPPAGRGHDAPAPRDAGAPAAARADADADAAPVSCRFDAAPFDPAALRARVGFLASPDLAGRAPGSDGDRAARAHIEARLACLGLAPGGPGGGYQQPFVDAAGRTSANVVAVLPGADPALRDQLIVVGAHHDHLGAARGQRFPGANDNASGVTALLALAQLAAERPVPPRRTLVFVAFGAEESPGDLGGSSHYAASPPATLPLERVVYMINLDMVGSYDSTGRVYALGGFRGLPGRALLDALAPAHASLRLVYGAAGRGSDHQPFCDRGVPYVFFWTPDRRCYHRRCDDADALDYPHMSEIGALAGELVLALADTDVDLPGSRARHACDPR